MTFVRRNFIVLKFQLSFQFPLSKHYYLLLSTQNNNIYWSFQKCQFNIIYPESPIKRSLEHITGNFEMSESTSLVVVCLNIDLTIGCFLRLLVKKKLGQPPLSRNILPTIIDYREEEGKGSRCTKYTLGCSTLSGVDVPKTSTLFNTHQGWLAKNKWGWHA